MRQAAVQSGLATGSEHSQWTPGQVLRLHVLLLKSWVDRTFVADLASPKMAELQLGVRVQGMGETRRSAVASNLAKR